MPALTLLWWLALAIGNVGIPLWLDFIVPTVGLLLYPARNSAAAALRLAGESLA